ncbi:MAG: insulinase family protein [Alphaproteobacteria bacterium]|nr:insulinase family protein [Alphaproteobacteria bacterium]
MISKFRFASWSLALGLLALISSTHHAMAAEAKVETFTMDNGMQVVVIPDHRAPVVTHMVWYRVGAADEPAGESGVAHFLEHLLFKGTKTVAPGEFSKTVRRNGGQENAFTSSDYTAYFQRIARDRLELMMKLESDRMTNLQLSKKDIKTERDVVTEERRSRVDNSPSGRLSEQVRAALYLNHPYGDPVIGWMHEIKQLNLKAVTAFYKRFYTPSNAILIVAGDITVEQLRPLAEKYYGVIPSTGPMKPRVRPLEPEPQAARRVTLTDPRVPTPSLRRIYTSASYSRAEPGEAEALDILSHILGTGTTSRLYQRLVVEQKIASYAGSWYSGDALDLGDIGLYAGPQAGSGKAELAAVEASIDAVIKEIILDGVTDQEVADAKNSLLSSTVYLKDDQMRRARIYGVALTTGQTVRDIEEWPSRIEAVSAKQVQDVARRYLKPRRSVTGLLLPEKTEQRAKAPSTVKHGDKS